MKRILYAACLSVIVTSNLHGEELSLSQVIERVLQHYPSVQTAALQVEIAKQESDRVNSQLGWNLNASGGYRHDFSLFGSPSNRLDIGAGLSRQLASGEQIGLQAKYVRDESDVPISPFYPNPASNVNLELNYRIPLQKGRDNISFKQSLDAARLNSELSEWQLKSLLDQLATQVIDLYFNYAVLQVRIHNSEASIARTEKLKQYLHRRAQLGIADDKDILQVDAQLKSQRAQLQAINIQLKQQQIALNRLMSRPWDSDFDPQLAGGEKVKPYSFDETYQSVLNASADIQQLNKKIKLAESKILLQQDKKKDQLDLVLFIGDKNLSGDIQTGSLSENELVGGARLEFNRGLDLSGYDAQIYQARLQRDMALQSKKQLMDDLKYKLATLLSQLDTGMSALKAYEKSVDAEQKKLKEAEFRYQDGRADTDQIIQFENQLFAASLSRNLQLLELQRLQLKVSLLQGVLWESIELPSLISLTGKGH